MLTVTRQGQTVLGPVGPDPWSIGVHDPCWAKMAAGKTTFLKALHGLERLSRVPVHMVAPDERSPADEAGLWSFQSPVMLRRPCAPNLGYPLAILGATKGRR